MPTPKLLARRAAPLVAILLVVAVAACARELPGVEPSAIPGPLVTVETRGGECPAGACGSTIAVEWDGRVHSLAPAAAEMGHLPENVRAALDRAVRVADFRRIASRPFTGECPTAFDGQETIYTFTTPTGPVRLASCEVEIDPSDPLFVAVQAAIDQFPQRGG